MEGVKKAMTSFLWLKWLHVQGIDLNTDEINLQWK